MKFFKKNIWWVSFVSVFIFGFLLIVIYCLLRNNFTIGNLTLSDWLNYFVASGTIGAFLFIMIDKLLNEKEVNHLKWQSQIPFVTLASPCDPTSSYCDINIVTNFNVHSERGSAYFSICNLSKINAYDISILFCKDENFTDSNIFNRHYIPYLQPLSVNENGWSNFTEYIYSNFNVNPVTKEISNSRFEICNCLQNCSISQTNSGEKFFFVKIEYYSSFSKSYRYKIISILQVTVICQNLYVPPEIQDNPNTVRASVTIKGIQFKDYKYLEE